MAAICLAARDIVAAMQWSPEHRTKAGDLIAEEIERRGWGRGRAAARLQVSEKQLQRVLRGSDEAGTQLVVDIAERLELDERDYLPPRSEAEGRQLDRIEAMLEEILEVLREDARPSVTRRAKAAAQRLADTPSTSPRKRRAQGGEHP